MLPTSSNDTEDKGTLRELRELPYDWGRFISLVFGLFFVLSATVLFNIVASDSPSSWNRIYLLTLAAASVFLYRRRAFAVNLAVLYFAYRFGDLLLMFLRDPRTWQPGFWADGEFLFEPSSYLVGFLGATVIYFYKRSTFRSYLLRARRTNAA